MNYLGRCLWKLLSIVVEWEDTCGYFLVLLLKESSLTMSHPEYGTGVGKVAYPVS